MVQIRHAREFKWAGSYQAKVRDIWGFLVSLLINKTLGSSRGPGVMALCWSVYLTVLRGVYLCRYTSTAGAPGKSLCLVIHVWKHWWLGRINKLAFQAVLVGFVSQSGVFCSNWARRLLKRSLSPRNWLGSAHPYTWCRQNSSVSLNVNLGAHCKMWHVCSSLMGMGKKQLCVHDMAVKLVPCPFKCQLQ